MNVEIRHCDSKLVPIHFIGFSFYLQNLPPALKNEIVVDRLANIQVRDKFETAKKECLELETQIKQLTDALHTLTRVQLR